MNEKLTHEERGRRNIWRNNQILPQVLADARYIGKEMQLS